MPTSIKYMDVPAFYDFFAEDHLSINDKKTFFAEQAAAYKEVVELGAGTGTIALHLADNDKHVTCIEPSIPVLNVLWSKVQRNEIYQQRITILPQSGQEFQLSKKADLIIAPNLLHLIKKEKDRRNILQNILNNLSPNGKLVVTFFNSKDLISEPRKLSGEKIFGNVTYRRYSQTEPIANKKFKLAVITWYFEIIYNATTLRNFKEDFLCRYDTEKYVRQLLSKSGFAIENIYSDYKRTYYSSNSNSDNLIVIAKPNKG